MKEQRNSIKIRVDNMDYEVVGGDFQQLLAAVKALPNRRFVGDLKLWLVSSSLDMVRGQLENSGFILEGGTPVPDTETITPSTFNARIKIKIPGYQATVTGAPFQDILTAIKAIPGRQFDGESKEWSLPGTLTETKDYFEKKGMQLEELSKVSLNTSSQKETPVDVPPLFEENITEENLANVPPPPPAPDIPPMPDDLDFFLEETSKFEDIPYYDEDPYFDSTHASPPPPMPTDNPIETPTKPSFSGRRDEIKVQVGDMSLVVIGGTFSEMLATIKTIPNRRFDAGNKQWILPDDINSVQQHIKAKGFKLEER